MGSAKTMSVAVAEAAAVYPACSEIMILIEAKARVSRGRALMQLSIQAGRSGFLNCGAAPKRRHSSHIIHVRIPLTNPAPDFCHSFKDWELRFFFSPFFSLDLRLRLPTDPTDRKAWQRRDATQGSRGSEVARRWSFVKVNAGLG